MMAISSRGEQIIRVAGAMMALTGLAVILRFFMRVRSKAALAADDWWVVASLVCFYVYMSIQLWRKYISTFCIVSLTLFIQS